MATEVVAIICYHMNSFGSCLLGCKKKKKNCGDVVMFSLRCGSRIDSWFCPFILFLNCFVSCARVTMFIWTIKSAWRFWFHLEFLDRVEHLTELGKGYLVSDLGCSICSDVYFELWWIWAVVIWIMATTKKCVGVLTAPFSSVTLEALIIGSFPLLPKLCWVLCRLKPRYISRERIDSVLLVGFHSNTTLNKGINTWKPLAQNALKRFEHLLLQEKTKQMFWHPLLSCNCCL